MSSGKRSQQKQMSLYVAVREGNSSALPLGKMVQEKQVGTAVFWVTAQRIVVISYRRFVQGSRILVGLGKNPCWILDSWRWGR